jgi:hypothetical protein
MLGGFMFYGIGAATQPSAIDYKDQKKATIEMSKNVKAGRLPMEEGASQLEKNSQIFLIPMGSCHLSQNF